MISCYRCCQNAPTEHASLLTQKCAHRLSNKAIGIIVAGRKTLIANANNVLAINGKHLARTVRPRQMDASYE